MCYVEFIKHCVEFIANAITIIAFPLALIGLCYTHRTFQQSIIALNQTKDIEEAKLWLQLRTDFYRYNNVHERLLTDKNSDFYNDRADLYGYLGQFELCNSMLDAGIVSLSTFKSQYKYRIEILLENNSIKEILISDTIEHWKNLAELFKKVGRQYPK